MNNTKFVSIFQPRDSIQAGLIQGALDHADIICYVNNENLSSIRTGGIGIGIGSMTVMVPETQAEEAIEIIKELGVE